jgi:hypothetical protein
MPSSNIPQTLRQGSDHDIGGDPHVPAWFDIDREATLWDKLPKLSAPPQSKAIRAEILDQAFSGFSLVSEAEIKAGATARAEIDKARRSTNAAGSERDRKRVTKICAGQRAGLVRVLRKLERRDEIVELSDRARKAVDLILDLSANMSVHSDCDWQRTRRWLEKAFPVLVLDHGVWMESRYRIHLRAAEAEMARRIPTTLSDYRTAASPREIAECLSITTAVLRDAKANRCGLTSVDPEPKRDRDRRGSENRRRGRGEVPQSQRTKTAENKALGATVGVTGNTIQNWKDKGILEEKLAERRAKLGL